MYTPSHAHARAVTLSPQTQGEAGGCPYVDSLTLPMAQGLWVTVQERSEAAAASAAQPAPPVEQ